MTTSDSVQTVFNALKVALQLEVAVRSIEVVFRIEVVRFQYLVNELVRSDKIVKSNQITYGTHAHESQTDKCSFLYIYLNNRTKKGCVSISKQNKR